ncbi:MAG: hypothetical protein BJ554DRAFT_2894 [Olpidium bornovanus]|uniref:Uncharacterized protein n=1 Tax=Olpidium bornovanus TaxID=278681 RepID=A0A8H7ZQ23_9FUNG|nr:MAG: hypothetical protein BJ554DRAFT_2894 [Olpidium bornovanus]
MNGEKQVAATQPVERIFCPALYRAVAAFLVSISLGGKKKVICMGVEPRKGSLGHEKQQKVSAGARKCPIAHANAAVASAITPATTAATPHSDTQRHDDHTDDRRAKGNCGMRRAREALAVAFRAAGASAACWPRRFPLSRAGAPAALGEARHRRDVRGFRGSARRASFWSTLMQTGAGPNAPLKGSVPDVLKEKVLQLKKNPGGETRGRVLALERDTVRFFQLVLQVSELASGCTSLSQIQMRTGDTASRFREMENDGLILEAPVSDDGLALLVTLDPNVGKKLPLSDHAFTIFLVGGVGHCFEAGLAAVDDIAVASAEAALVPASVQSCSQICDRLLRSLTCRYFSELQRAGHGFHQFSPEHLAHGRHWGRSEGIDRHLRRQKLRTPGVGLFPTCSNAGVNIRFMKSPSGISC